MIGFILGVAFAVGVYKFSRRGGFGGFGPPWARGGYGGGGRWGEDRPRWYLRGLFERLRTSPGQERVIEAAVDELRSRAGKFREEKDRSRADLGRALREERFDPQSLAAMFERHDATLREVRRALIDQVAKVHEALDPAQRSQLAEMIERGFGHGHGFGHGWGHHHGWGRGRCGHSGRGYADYQTV